MENEELIKFLEESYTSVEAFYEASNMLDYFDNISAPLKSMGAKRIRQVNNPKSDLDNNLQYITDEWVMPSGIHIFAGYKMDENETEAVADTLIAAASDLNRERNKAKQIPSVKDTGRTCVTKWVIFALILFFFYSIFFWPTLYVYEHGEKGTLIRIHRVTGKTETLSSNRYWRETRE